MNRMDSIPPGKAVEGIRIEVFVVILRLDLFNGGIPDKVQHRFLVSIYSRFLFTRRYNCMMINPVLDYSLPSPADGAEADQGSTCAAVDSIGAACCVAGERN